MVESAIARLMILKEERAQISKSGVRCVIVSASRFEARAAR